MKEYRVVYKFKYSDYQLGNVEVNENEIFKEIIDSPNVYSNGLFLLDLRQMRDFSRFFVLNNPSSIYINNKLNARQIKKIIKNKIGEGFSFKMGDRIIINNFRFPRKTKKSIVKKIGSKISKDLEQIYKYLYEYKR